MYHIFDTLCANPLVDSETGECYVEVAYLGQPLETNPGVTENRRVEMFTLWASDIEALLNCHTLVDGVLMLKQWNDTAGRQNMSVLFRTRFIQWLQGKANTVATHRLVNWRV